MISTVPSQSGMPPLLTDTGSTLFSDMQETMTVTQGDAVETITIGDARPGETVVVTVGGERQTLTIGTNQPPKTGEYFLP